MDIYLSLVISYSITTKIPFPSPPLLPFSIQWYVVVDVPCHVLFGRALLRLGLVRLCGRACSAKASSEEILAVDVLVEGAAADCCCCGFLPLPLLLLLLLYLLPLVVACLYYSVALVCKRREEGWH
jgi:hypothetical protein